MPRSSAILDSAACIIATSGVKPPDVFDSPNDVPDPSEGIRVLERPWSRQLATRALVRRLFLHPLQRRETVGTPRAIPENCHREIRIEYWRGTAEFDIGEGQEHSGDLRPARTGTVAVGRARAFVGGV